MPADSADLKPAYQPRKLKLLLQLRNPLDAIFRLAENSHDRIDGAIVDSAQSFRHLLKFRLMRDCEALRLDNLADRVEVVAQTRLDRRAHLRAVAPDKHHQRRGQPIVGTLVPSSRQRAFVNL